MHFEGINSQGRRIDLVEEVEMILSTATGDMKRVLPE